MEIFKRHMIVYGQVVHCDTLNDAADEWVPETGAQGLTKCLLARRVQFTEVAYRTADRMLQKMRKDGIIEFKGNSWYRK